MFKVQNLFRNIQVHANSNNFPEKVQKAAVPDVIPAPVVLKLMTSPASSDRICVNAKLVCVPPPPPKFCTIVMSFFNNSTSGVSYIIDFEFTGLRLELKNDLPDFKDHHD